MPIPRPCSPIALSWARLWQRTHRHWFGFLPPSMGEDRVTLSAGALRSAASVHILMSGADKYTALQAAMLAGEVADAPIRAILHGHQRWDVYFKD